MTQVRTRHVYTGIAQKLLCPGRGLFFSIIIDSLRDLYLTPTAILKVTVYGNHKT